MPTCRAPDGCRRHRFRPDIPPCRPPCVHGSAAQFFLGRHFPGRRLQQGRAGQEHLERLAAHYDHVIGQAGLIGSARRCIAVHHGHLRQAHRRQAGLVGESARALRQKFPPHGSGWRRRFRTALTMGSLFCAVRSAAGEASCAGRWGNGAALDRAVAGADQATHAVDQADAGNHVAAGLSAVLVVVHHVAGQSAQFHEGRSGVEQVLYALVRQNLAAFGELWLGLIGLVQHLLLDGVHSARSVPAWRAVGDESRRCAVNDPDSMIGMITPPFGLVLENVWKVGAMESVVRFGVGVIGQGIDPGAQRGCAVNANRLRRI
jgi:hypothetical protein